MPKVKNGARRRASTAKHRLKGALITIRDELREYDDHAGVYSIDDPDIFIVKAVMSITRLTKLCRENGFALDSYDSTPFGFHIGVIVRQPEV